MDIVWEKRAEGKFHQLINKAPVFLRDMARKKVAQKAENLAVQANHPQVTEKDMVDAFFAETPFGFHGPMKTDMQELGIDYTQYGHDR